MTTEAEYKHAVTYLTRLLNGGLMGERGSKPLRTAIERVSCKSKSSPSRKAGLQTSARIVMRTWVVFVMTATTRTLVMSAVQSVGRDSSTRVNNKSY